MFDGSPQHQVTDSDLERALVALVLADNAALSRLGKLTPDDMQDPILGAALAAALDLAAEGRPANLVTMRSRLQAIPLDDGKTGLDAIRSLSFGGTLPKVEDICHRLRSLAVRRRLGDYLGSLAHVVVDESQGITGIAADAIQQLNDYLLDAVETEHTSFHPFTAANEFIDRLKTGNNPIEIPTGFRDLDETTGGWHRGEFAILAGRPSMGKSTVALCSMLRTAELGLGVLFFSLEMTKDQLVARALADYAYTDPVIAYSDMKPGRVSDAQMRRLEDAAKRFESMNIEIETKSGLTVAEIMGRARRTAESMKAKGSPLALIVVDHMLKITPSSRYAGQPVKELDEVSQGMCVMAKSLNVAVLGLHQLNRQVESRDNPRPVMSDLRGSGTLEQDADVVMFAYRPAYQFERQAQEPDKKAEAEAAAGVLKHELELQVAKQRNGPTRMVELWCDMSANVVRNKAWRR